MQHSTLTMLSGLKSRLYCNVSVIQQLPFIWMVTLQPTSLLPSPTLQITRFLQFVKNVYADLPRTMVSHSLSLGPSSLPVSVWCCYWCFPLLPDLSFWARRGRDPWRYIQRLLSKYGMLVPSLFFLHLADLWSSLYVPLMSSSLCFQRQPLLWRCWLNCPSLWYSCTR